MQTQDELSKSKEHQLSIQMIYSSFGQLRSERNFTWIIYWKDILIDCTIKQKNNKKQRHYNAWKAWKAKYSRSS